MADKQLCFMAILLSNKICSIEGGTAIAVKFDHVQKE